MVPFLFSFHQVVSNQIVYGVVPYLKRRLSVVYLLLAIFLAEIFFLEFLRINYSGLLILLHEASDIFGIRKLESWEGGVEEKTVCVEVPGAVVPNRTIHSVNLCLRETGRDASEIRAGQDRV